ncbi:YL1 nuclear protein C-terminal domain-containing protein [Phlebopus sp. FC_14]|nr:YL1 nuclear protein C-terminal domain-containing protein [Phlebopus sp. FC_14]
MPPKGATRKKAFNDSSTSHTPTLAETLSLLHIPRPFKNPSYTKNINRRTKNLKTVLGQERERERLERERRRGEREWVAGIGGVVSAGASVRGDAMDVDAVDANAPPPPSPSQQPAVKPHTVLEEDVPTYTSIEAPPSLLPQRHYCDITGLEAPYTDPRTGLRYHDKSVYEIIKGLSPSVAKDYLSARGVNPIVR